MGAGSPKFRIWPTISAGWKKKVKVGKFALQARADFADIIGGGAVLAGVQRNQDFAVEGADGGGVAERDVEAAVGQADVVENVGQLGGRNHLADGIFHLREYCSVSSMRVPAGARTCRRIWPASTCGKKSVPSMGVSARQTATSRKKQTATNLRCARAEASMRAVALRAAFSNQRWKRGRRDRRFWSRARGRLRRQAGTGPWWGPACARAGTRPSSPAPRPAPAA